MAIKVANNNSLSAITSLPSAITAGAMTLLSTQTASSSSTISFTSGIDSTYDEYVFKFIDIHPATDNAELSFQANASGGSGYNETMTTTTFRSQQTEGAANAEVAYDDSRDQAQGTSFQSLCVGVGNDNDQCNTGYLHLYNPSSTTFVKNFIARNQTYEQSDHSVDMFTAGYINTTSAITEIQFKMSSGNIDSGVIKLYGIS